MILGLSLLKRRIVVVLLDFIVLGSGGARVTVANLFGYRKRVVSSVRGGIALVLRSSVLYGGSYLGHLLYPGAASVTGTEGEELKIW